MSHDLQAAYEVSQLRADRDPDVAAIARLQQTGLFVVVSHHIAYCPITDATLPGSTRQLAHAPQADGGSRAAAFSRLEDAITLCQALGGDEDASECGEVSFTVTGPDGATAYPTRADHERWHRAFEEATAEDGIPF